ncbi:MAG TPA: hypothetical protein VFG71_10770, partial [Nitrospiraceae bacterium]|nr:hypothetical protein [Nitrospiraceae bacterium]
FVGFSTTLSMGGVSFARLLTGSVCLELTRRIRRLLSFSRSTTFGYISYKYYVSSNALPFDDEIDMASSVWTSHIQGNTSQYPGYGGTIQTWA